MRPRSGETAALPYLPPRQVLRITTASLLFLYREAALQRVLAALAQWLFRQPCAHSCGSGRHLESPPAAATLACQRSLSRTLQALVRLLSSGTLPVHAVTATHMRHFQCRRSRGGRSSTAAYARRGALTTSLPALLHKAGHRGICTALQAQQECAH